MSHFISDKTTYFYKNAQGTEKDYILIFGDEIELTGRKQNKRVEAIVRDRKGWIKESEIGDSPSLEVYFIDVGQVHLRRHSVLDLCMGLCYIL